MNNNRSFIEDLPKFHRIFYTFFEIINCYKIVRLIFTEFLSLQSKNSLDYILIINSRVLFQLGFGIEFSSSFQNSELCH